jgi:hypothetical protein
VTTIQIVPVDERDSGWEDDRPRFRVYLHGSGETETLGSTSTYDVTGADVLQVIDWAQRRAGEERTYAVALVCDDRLFGGEAPERGLVWLVGMDGNDIADDERGLPRQQRMLARRRHPVGVPEADRMPAPPTPTR